MANETPKVENPTAQLEAAMVNQLAQALIPMLLEKLSGLLSGLFTKKAGQPPIATPKVPNPVRLPDDDFINPPVQTVPAKTISRVTLHLQKAQYSAKLFPDMYTEQNPQGLYDNPGQYEDGKSALNRESKIWLDITAYDLNGNEMGEAEINNNHLAFTCEHKVTDQTGKVTRITGKGTDPTGKPMPWEQVEDSFMGLGITSWQNSLGFNEQMKAFGEGTITCTASVGTGVNLSFSNTITLRFS